MAADGSGAQGKLITFNDTQWTGDFLAAGVGSIGVDFRTSGSALSMRLALKSGFGGTPGYVTDAFALPGDGLWHHAVFTLDAAHLTAVGGPDPLDTFLTSVGEMRILNSSGVSLTGDAITATVGIDNVAVAAGAVPEPWSLGGLGIGGVGLLFRRRR
jgi:hypothetical protein